MATPTEVATEINTHTTVAVPVVLAVRVEVRVSSRSNSRALHLSTAPPAYTAQSSSLVTEPLSLVVFDALRVVERR